LNDTNADWFRGKRLSKHHPRNMILGDKRITISLLAEYKLLWRIYDNSHRNTVARHCF
jgi:hypothetical protein